MSTAHDELVVQFVEMTGSDPETAMSFLEMSQFDIEKALNLMFSGDIQPPTTERNVSSSKKDGISFVESEEEVRKADPVQQEVLLDYNSQSARQQLNSEAAYALSRAEDPSVEWMYAPPRHLSFPGTLPEARATARNEKKWILVNIQCDKEFASHLLNRDVWTNEALVSLIRTNFIFWQRGNTSQDGQMFLSMHQLDPNYPMIGIVDSRTGALATKFRVGRKTEANDLILNLMEFLDANDIDDNIAPKDTVAHRYAQSDSAVQKMNKMKSKYDEEDDEEDDCRVKLLAKAMEQSLNTKAQTNKVDEDAQIEKTVEKGSLEPHQNNIYNNLTAEDVACPDEQGCVKVSIKLAPELVQAISLDNNSKPIQSIVRLFHGEKQTVYHVYATVFLMIKEHYSSLPPDVRDRNFDLLTAFPRASLKDKRDISVTDAGLKGARVVMEWI